MHSSSHEILQNQRQPRPAACQRKRDNSAGRPMSLTETRRPLPVHKSSTAKEQAKVALRLSVTGQSKGTDQITVQEVMGDPLIQHVKTTKAPSARRPISSFFRRRSSSSPPTRRSSVDSAGGEITYATSSDETRLTSPSMPSLALFRPRSRRAEQANDVIVESSPANSPGMPSKPFARRPDSAETVNTSGSMSPRPSIMSSTSARTSQTSYNSTSYSARRAATESTGPPSPVALRPVRRASSAATPTAEIRPGPSPVTGSSRTPSATRPLRSRTASRLSFSSITQTLGASAPRPPPDPATAARLRTLPRLLSYTSSPPGSSSNVPTTSDTSDLPPPVGSVLPSDADMSPPYQEREAESYWAARQTLSAPEQPVASTSSSLVEAEPARASPIDPSETEDDTDDEDTDAFVHPELVQSGEAFEEIAAPARLTPRTPRMRLDMPLRSSPDRFVATPVSTPRTLAPTHSPAFRGTPQMPGWTTFATTPGLTPFTARPDATTTHSGSYFDLRPLADEPETALSSPVMVTAATSPADQSSPILRPALNSRRSRSLVNLLDTVHEPEEPASLAIPASPRQRSPSPGRAHSMYEMRDLPPSYNPLDAAPVPAWFRERAQQLVMPRDDEGRERLPNYTCDVHIEGYVPRKMEFTAPGIQAGNRAWRKQYVVLHGTCIKIYKADPSVYPVPDEPRTHSDARRMSVSSTTSYASSTASVASSDSDTSKPSPLHVHEGRYGEVPGESNEGFATALIHSHLPLGAAGHNSCLRNYSLQNAESGLAADYLKRKHVVRVRAEGEQFLIQARDDRGVIDWIEALQAATNVSLDLDARPLPKFITLPRRRRRRRRPEDAAAAEAAAAAAGAATGTNEIPAPQGGRMHDMLAEEQEAYMRS